MDSMGRGWRLWWANILKIHSRSVRNFQIKCFENEIYILFIETDFPVREYKITNDDCHLVDFFFLPTLGLFFLSLKFLELLPIFVQAYAWPMSF